MLLTAQRPPGATPAGERGLLWGMEDLSSALRAQALLQDTGHLQTDLGRVMAGRTNLLFKEG